MAYFFLAMVFFVMNLMSHLMYCRQTKRKGLQAKAFVAMAILFLSTFFLASLAGLHSRMLDPQSWWGMPFIFTSAFIYILLVPVYLCFYVLTQLTSPSQKILSVISQQGELGFNEILAAIEKEDFIRTRLEDLLLSHCVIEQEGHYSLTAEGKKLANILDFMQMILGRKVGG